MARNSVRVRQDAVWRPAPVSLDVARAVRSVGTGEASADQQKLAMRWIIHFASGASSETFVPDVPGASDYLAGRRSVGLQIVDVMAGDMGRFRQEGEIDA